MNGVAGDVELADRARRRACRLLRRWLAETHTPVEPGPLSLRIGPVRVSAEVAYRSPTGAHGFGPIRVLDAEGVPVALADPVLLAAACSADSRSRSLPSAPINAPDAGTAVDWVLSSLADDEDDEVPAGMTAEEAVRLLSRQVDDLPRSPGADPWSLVAGPLAAIGRFGRAGIADECWLLEVLAGRLRAVDDDLSRSWLSSPTLADRAVLVGEGLRYRPDVRPVPFDVPNPLHEGKSDVPPPPVPVLGGPWSLRPVEVAVHGDGGPDVALVHRWMNTPHVAHHWNQAWPLERWREELAHQLGGEHSLPCVVGHEGREVAYLELYRVTRDKLAGCYPYGPHDLGVHIAIGEREVLGRGFGSSLLRAVAGALLDADPRCARVVAEPNVHNEASVRAFAKAGFVREREIGLPAKNSALMVFSRV
ncbi:siderophore biosynthesis protein [Saccharopolyspora erythraea D]|nr:siderophore biosynthesis protein [Saccharopolyspora erythraea D]